MKCHACNKVLNKKNPALECSRCQKVVHAITTCAGLSSKQLAALKAAENLDWTCNDCSNNSSRRKSFVNLEEYEDDEEEDQTPAMEDSAAFRKYMQSLKKEVGSIVAAEMRSFGNSVQYCADKVDEFAETLHALTSRIKEQDKKIMHLENKNKNLELRVESLEQRNDEIEQLLLGDQVEMSGIPESNDADLPKLVEYVADKLGAPKEDIVSVKRLAARRAAPGAVLVKLRHQDARQRLMKSSRDTVVLARDLVPDLTGPAATEKIYVREALTSYNKNLLWQAKQDLKGIYKFIWCREGRVLARKDEKAKVLKIRSKSDLQSLVLKK